MEIYIAKLELKPESNKNIKIIAQYLENIIMPNEEVLAVLVNSHEVMFGTYFIIVTNKRVILKSKFNGIEIMTPLDKVQTVMQNGTIANVNGNGINLHSVEKANKIVSLINKQVSSTQTVSETIKIENKIVTEESITSQLQKLSSLHDAKVLTDYEYSIKKQELLDKMK
jgi:histidyl-tRNA synthetase